MARLDLAGKGALVTGAARGIGLETARALAARGARVVLTDLDADDAQRAAAAVGPGAIGLGADVADAEAMRDVVATAIDRLGRLDVVVANAGIGSRGATAAAMDPDVWERVVSVDLLGVWRTVRPALPEIARRGGQVVLIGSIYSFSNGTGATPYAVSKAGVEALGRALRVELAPHGGGATVAYFGWIATELVHRMVDADPLAERMLETLPRPLRKRLQPAAAGRAIADAVERRAARVFLPRRWAVVSALRGVGEPLIDRWMARDAKVQALVRDLDARAAEAQPTSA